MSPSEIFRGIAAALGEGWVYREGYSVHGTDGFIDGPDKQSLRLEMGKQYRENERGKVYVIGLLGDLHKHMSGSKSFRIGVSVGKGFDRVARDIRRRLLPVYREELAEARERKRAWDRDEKAKEELARVISATVGGHRVSHSPDRTIWYHRDNPCSARVTGSSEVEFKLRLDAEQAKKLATWLRENR